jgi:tripartite motif-containing protein 71
MKRTLLIIFAVTLLIPAWNGPWTPHAAATAEVAPGYTFERATPDRQHYPFNYITDADTNLEGHVYVTDYSNNEIVKLDGNGNILLTWQGDNNFRPKAIAASVSDVVYASNGGSIDVIDVTSSSPPLSTIGMGQFSYITGMAIDRNSGILYAADPDENTIWRIDGAQITEWGSYLDSLGNPLPFEYPSAVDLDSEGNIYVLQDGNQVIKLDPQGVLIKEYNTADYYSIAAIDVDAAGTIYAVDNDQSVALKWDDNGLTPTMGSVGSKNLQFSSPGAVAVDDNGMVYVVDTDNKRVQKLDANLGHLATWGNFGGEEGQFHYPEGIAVTPNGEVYVADSFNDRIQKFDPHFSFIEERGYEGDPDSFYPYAIAADRSGDIYFTSYNQLFKYNAAEDTTELLYDGFSETRAIAVDNAGNIYVADTGRNRVIKLLPNGDFVSPRDCCG